MLKSIAIEVRLIPALFGALEAPDFDTWLERTITCCPALRAIACVKQAEKQH
jgi:hypothetical protein